MNSSQNSARNGGFLAGTNYLSRKNNDDAHFFNCLWVAGVGAAFGAIYGSVF